MTLLIGDLKSRNFALAADADRRAALGFVTPISEIPQS